MEDTVDRSTAFTAARTRLSGIQRWVAIFALALCTATFLGSWVLGLQLLVSLFLLSSATFLSVRFMAVITALRMEPKMPAPILDPEDLPVITLLCPLYREAEGIDNLVGALNRLNYPREKREVLLLIEEDDDETERGLTRQIVGLRIIKIPAGGPRTKPNALNIGLRAASGQIVGVYDAEDRPQRDQLQKAAEAFAADPQLGCVQARLNYYNREDNILTRLFCLEYALQFDHVLPGLERLGLPLPLGGTSNFIKRDALMAVGGWDPFNVTEDADLGIRLFSAGYAVGTIDSTTFEEATDTVPHWIKQRSRWTKGFMQTWLVHTRSFLGWREALIVHGAIGAVALNALMAPWAFAGFFGWLMSQADFLEPVFTSGLEKPALVLMIGGNAAHAWFLMMAPLERQWLSLPIAGLLLPLYWLLLSVAAYRALFGLLKNPHYWAKTDHSQGEDSEREASGA